MKLYGYGEHYLIPMETADLSVWPEKYILVMDSREFSLYKTVCGFAEPRVVDFDSIRLSKVESHFDYYLGTFLMPNLSDTEDDKKFVYYIKPGRIVFVDDKNTVLPLLQCIVETKNWQQISPERFLFDFFDDLTGDDIDVLEELEERISNLEDAVLAGNLENFNEKMIVCHKELLTLLNCYTQIIEIAHTFHNNENNCFQINRLYLFRLFAERTERLKNNTQSIREYSMQIREVYRSSIELRQNNIMTVFTIITSVFTPLTFIVGWYGMNFVHMPELHWQYGYPAVILISILTVLLCLWLFKKKKYI
ncbi:MAG: cobalt transporter [Negativicutes bacterium]|nr:cobalt transporter [Negativicutes bacterium]